MEGHRHGRKNIVRQCDVAKLDKKRVCTGSPAHSPAQHPLYDAAISVSINNQLINARCLPGHLMMDVGPAVYVHASQVHLIRPDHQVSAAILLHAIQVSKDPCPSLFARFKQGHSTANSVWHVHIIS